MQKQILNVQPNVRRAKFPPICHPNKKFNEKLWTKTWTIQRATINDHSQRLFWQSMETSPMWSPGPWPWACHHLYPWPCVKPLTSGLGIHPDEPAVQTALHPTAPCLPFRHRTSPYTRFHWAKSWVYILLTTHPLTNNDKSNIRTGKEEQARALPCSRGILLLKQQESYNNP